MAIIMKGDKLKARMLDDLKNRKIDGLLTAEIAKRYRISVDQAYNFMFNRYQEGFKSDDGATLMRNSGTEELTIKHTHWFFS
jgi:hypothetical protein